MTDAQIRAKIEAVPEWKGTLIGFENCVCEVAFSKNYKWYGIRPKGTKGFVDDMFTTLGMTSIESLVAFMQGALWFRLHGKEFKNEQNTL